MSIPYTNSATALASQEEASQLSGIGHELDIVILAGSIERRESRGSPHRTDYPERDDRFLKTTVADYDAADDRPRLTFEPVEIGLVPPRARTYGRVDPKKTAPPKASRETVKSGR